MKVAKADGVKLLKALNFERAGEWPEEKLIERLSQVPEKVAQDEVPKGFEKLYANLCEAKGAIELTGGDAKAKTNGKAEVKSKPAAKPAAKPEKAKAKTPEKAKAKKAGGEGKNRLKGLSEDVDKLIKFSAEEIYAKLKGKYPITPSWLNRVVERKKKALKKTKAIKA